MKTMQQQMAVIALAKIRAVERGDARDKQKYGTMAHKLPLLIRNTGLAQALAFVEARGENAQKQLLADVAETINFAEVSGRDDLVSLSRTADLATYMLLTRRVMAALVWYKRFTESVLKISNTGSSADPAAPAN